jgi:hypothetical protein
MGYRELTGDEIINDVNPICVARGWAPLNVNDATPTCYVIGAFDDNGKLAGFFCLQLHPVIGPMWVDSENRDGSVSRELAESMDKFIKASNVRGVLAITDSPVSERLAERHGMVKLESPVYISIGA